MTRLIPRVILFMMVVSLLFIATAAANMAGPVPEPHSRYDYYNYVIERIQSHLGYEVEIIPYDSRVAHIISGNFHGLADGYNSDRLQDLINNIRTRV